MMSNDDFSLYSFDQGRKQGMEDAKPKWISVKDKLPENKQVVLVFNTYGEMAVCECKKDYQYFFILLDTSLQIRDVTHWIDLPEPPK